jgi:iron(III) transport system substrate-binding protein
MANPQFGTTRGHVAAWFALWGAERAAAFLQDLHDREVIIADGNSSVVRQVIAGNADLGMTDTDDVWVARRLHPSLDLIYADQGDGGTLWIPNTVALVKGAKHPRSARRLIDFLVSADVEEMLARSRSGNIPVRESSRARLGLEWPASGTPDYQRIADHMPAAISAAREILLR